MSFKETLVKFKIFNIGLGDEKFYCSIRHLSHRVDFEFKNDISLMELLSIIEDCFNKIVMECQNDEINYETEK